MDPCELEHFDNVVCTRKKNAEEQLFSFQYIIVMETYPFVMEAYYG